MENTQVTCIFLEPPGNIQKELHELRLTYARHNNNPMIIAFPEVIPLIYNSVDANIELSNIEKNVRGNVQIIAKPETNKGWNFLPVLLGGVDICKTALMLNVYSTVNSKVPDSWHIGKLSFGKASSTSCFLGFGNLSEKHQTISFTSGKLVKAHVLFLNDQGTSYAIEILDSLYRKKLKPS